MLYAIYNNGLAKWRMICMAKAQEWEEISRRVVYHKYSQTIEQRDYKLPDGSVSDYYLRIEKPGVCVLAITNDNKVVTLPQFRPGPGKILREIPGGQVENGEDHQATALRELLEETGYTGEVEDWVGTWESDAYTQLSRQIYIVKNCAKVTEQNLQAREFGEVELVPMADFVAQVRTGQLTDAAGALLALDHLKLLA